MQYQLTGPAQPMAEPAEPAASGLRELWAAVFRSRYWVAGIMAACIALAIVATLLATRLYEASTSIEVRQEAEKVLGTEADQESAASKADTERFLQTQLDIIRSRGIANTVAEKLGLYRGAGFLDAMRIEEDVDGSGPLSPREAKRDQVLEALGDNLAARYTGDTRIAVITFRSPDARLSTRVADAYADAFIRSNLSRKADSSAYALDFLRDQLRDAQERLERSEQAAVGYARRTRIVDASNAAAATSGGEQGRPQSLVTAQLVQLNAAYTAAVADRIAAEQKWTRTSGLPLLSIPDVLSNQAVQGLIERRAQAGATREQLLATKRDDFPAVREASAQTRELNAQVNNVARSIRDSIESQFEVAQARERELLGQIDSLKSSTLAEQNQGIELSILRREADTNRQQYEALLRRFNDLNAQAGIQTNNLSIVDRARLPLRPAWPKLPLNLAAALIFGTVLSAAFVLAREQLFNFVRTPDEVVDGLKLPLLGVVPTSSDLQAELADSKSAASDAFSSIRTSLSLISDHGVPRSVMFTSTQQGEGKSNACHAMALSLARLGKRVLVVDVDLRRPNAHRLFDLPNGPGFSNVMSGQRALEQAIVKTRDARIDLLTAGDIPPNPTELINGGQLPELLAQLQRTYDVVLVDSAPVLGLADAVILSRRVEATAFVIESGRNTTRGIQTALSRLAQADGHVVGAILTKYDPGKLGYGYGAQYGYHYDYASAAPAR